MDLTWFRMLKTQGAEPTCDSERIHKVAGMQWERNGDHLI